MRQNTTSFHYEMFCYTDAYRLLKVLTDIVIVEFGLYMLLIYTYPTQGSTR